MDVATRELLPDVIRWVKFSGAVWTRDGFYYSGYDEPKQSEALVAQNRFQKIFFHKLGTEQSADRLIYEDRAHPLRYVSAEVSKDDRASVRFRDRGHERQRGAVGRPVEGRARIRGTVPRLR